MAFKWKSFLNKLKDVVVPIVGTAVGGPLGGILGGALAGATGRGRPKLGNIVRGAGTAAAGIGISKGLSALKGAMTGAGSATQAVTKGVTEPTALLAKGRELAPSLPTVSTQAITPPPVSPLASVGAATKESGVMDKLKGLFGKGGWIERNPEIAKGIAMGAFEAFQEDPRMAQLEFEKKAYEDEQERRRRVAELLRPLYEQTYRSLGS